MKSVSKTQGTGLCSVLKILEREFDMAFPGGEDGVFPRGGAEALSEFEDELERNNYIEAVASAYKVSRESLEKLVAKTAIGTGMARPVRRGRKRRKGGCGKRRTAILTSQKALLTWMIENEKLY